MRLSRSSDKGSELQNIQFNEVYIGILGILLGPKVTEQKYEESDDGSSVTSCE
jgi:hypothetical protein